MRVIASEEYRKLENRNDIQNANFFHEYIGTRYLSKKSFANVFYQLKKRNKQTAVELLNRKLKFKPNNIDAMRFKAEIYFCNNLYLEAWDVLEDLLYLLPKDPEGLFLSAICAHIANKVSEKEEKLKQLQFISKRLFEEFNQIVHLVESNKNRLDFSQDIPKEIQFDVFILHGERLKENGEMTDSAKARVQLACEMLDEFPSAKVIVCGGPVHNNYLEGLASYNYLLHLGINEQRIIMDVSTLDIVSNVVTVSEIILQQAFKNVCIVSTSDLLARRWLALTCRFKYLGLRQPVYGIAKNFGEIEEIPDREIHSMYNTVVRSWGIFEVNFFNKYSLE